MLKWHNLAPESCETSILYTNTHMNTLFSSKTTIISVIVTAQQVMDMVDQSFGNMSADTWPSHEFRHDLGNMMIFATWWCRLIHPTMSVSCCWHLQLRLWLGHSFKTSLSHKITVFSMKERMQTKLTWIQRYFFRVILFVFCLILYNHSICKHKYPLRQAIFFLTWNHHINWWIIDKCSHSFWWLHPIYLHCSQCELRVHPHLITRNHMLKFSRQRGDIPPLLSDSTG